ncbi:MAG TPA: Gldg family protein [Caldilineaceae bacterium]|nr:Gldg family protein [Caldilineaceae bacterium]
MRQILSVTRKELDSYFGSPMALIFLGAFLAVTLFVFFWVETFFARGIADIRPLFEWMPLLLIFLVAALTMRQWSEEQRGGTLEMLLTLPVKPWQLVAGKFLAVMALVGVALVLTLPLTISVAMLGPLDWGPVIGGYLAALLLAAAYTAIGLFISSLTDNQIVALISTAIVGGIFYMAGTATLQEYAGAPWSGILRNIGTGSRFESIQRGVIDLRDLIYYLSIAGIFLVLNTLSLDSKRWSHGPRTVPYRRNATLFASLAVINLLLLNIWLTPLQGLRADLTAQGQYSLSDVTKDMLANLQEPLLIRGYISEKSHPLLNPLRPQIADLLREYEIAGRGNVTAEVIDPISDPDLEAEANQTYNINPFPFQVSGRYEASVINSYFDILVRYGDQNVVLNFQDLIEITPNPTGSIDVRLRNLEYDLTSAIKKVVFGFQSVESVLAALSEPVELTLYTTPDTTPPDLQEAITTIQTVAQSIADDSGGKFIFNTVNPDDPNSGITRQQLFDDYNLQPFLTSLFSNDSYYLHMVLKNGNTQEVIYPTNDLSEGAIRSQIENALKRSSTGFLKTVGLWTPPSVPTQDMFGQQRQPLAAWQNITQHLSQEYTVRNVDLSTGQAPSDIDTLFVIMPENMTDKERFAIDQFLMRGGAVIVAASNYKVDVDPLSQGLTLTPLDGTLNDILRHYGVDVQQSLVMDDQNQPFPVTVQRNVGGFQVQEIQAINFPYFVDVRQDGMTDGEALVAGLPAVTMNFVSPVTTNLAEDSGRSATVLMQSSANSWLTTNTNIQPDLTLYPERGFAVEGEQKAQPLAVVVQGTFESFFKDKPSPFTEDATTPIDPNAAPTPTPAGPAPDTSVLTQSPASARLVVFGSAEFLDDFVLRISSQIVQDQILNNLQFAQNAVDWAVEDTDLLTIRSRGTFTRLLDPMTESEQARWEFGNYAVALLALLVIAGFWYVRRRNEQPMELTESTLTPIAAD